MRCPTCGSSDIYVLDSRAVAKSNSIRRRRECAECHLRFTTYEFININPAWVVKSDGSREEFSREKMIKSMQIPCAKRSVAIEDIEKIADAIELSIDAANRKEISSKEIGEMVMKHLKELDKVAYIRFASVYREFKDVTEFKTEIEDLESNDAT